MSVSTNNGALRNAGEVTRGSTIHNGGVIGGLGKRGGESGAINRGASTISNRGPIGELGKRGGDSGAISRGKSTIPNKGGVGDLGKRAGDSGAINRGKSTIPNKGGVGDLGKRSGDSGLINRGKSTIPTKSAIGALGKRSGDSGSINRGKSTIANKGPIGSLGKRSGDSGAINRGKSKIPNKGAIGKLGKRSGNSGAINRGKSAIPNKGGLKRGGGLSRRKREGRKPRATRGARKIGGGRRPKREVTYREIICGSPVSGNIELAVTFYYDDWGRMIRDVAVWKAVINGTEWTPARWDNIVREDGGLAPGYYGVQSLGTSIRRRWEKNTAKHSPGCFVHFNQPDSRGAIVSRDTQWAIVTGGTTSDVYMLPDRGQAIFSGSRVLIAP